MGLSEMKARFRGYRRREEEIEEARLVEHNRNVSELFTSMVFILCLFLVISFLNQCCTVRCVHFDQYRKK